MFVLMMSILSHSDVLYFCNGQEMEKERETLEIQQSIGSRIRQSKETSVPISKETNRHPF